jgi:hypothetical protein
MFALVGAFPTSLVSSTADTTLSIVAFSPGGHADAASSSSSNKTTPSMTSGRAPLGSANGKDCHQEGYSCIQTTEYLRRGIIMAQGLGDLVSPISQWLIKHQLHYSCHIFSRQN